MHRNKYMEEYIGIQDVDYLERVPTWFTVQKFLVRIFSSLKRKKQLVGFFSLLEHNKNDSKN